MIYAGQSKDFPQLTKVLKDFGIPEDALQTAMEYLDMEKPQNDGLLQKLHPATIHDPGYQTNTLLKTAVHEEILRSNDPALRKRYILLCYALGGSTCMNLLPIGWEQIRETITEAYGESSKAILPAIQADSILNRNSYNFTLPDDRILCMEAADLCTSDPPRGKMLLCAAVLESAEPKKKRSFLKRITEEKTDPLVQRALTEVISASRITGTSQERGIMQWNNLLYRAIAAGAPFSIHLQKLLHENRFYPSDVMQCALTLPVRPAVIAGALAEYADPAGFSGLISLIAGCRLHQEDAQRMYGYILPDRDEILKVFCVKYPKETGKAMAAQDDPQIALRILEAVRKTASDTKELEDSLQKAMQRKCMAHLSATDELKDYLINGGDITPFVETLLDIAEKSYHYTRSFDYISAYGLDAFACRAVCVQLLSGGYLQNCPGFRIAGQEAEAVKRMAQEKIPASAMLRAGAIQKKQINDFDDAGYFAAMQPWAAEIAALDTKKFSVDARIFRIQFLAFTDAQAYQDTILSLAGDGSKSVREALLDLCKQYPQWDLKPLFLSRSVKVREFAVQALEIRGIGQYTDILQNALKTEKSASLRSKIAVLLGMEARGEDTAPAAADPIRELLKGNRARKLAWLFEQPFTPVHSPDGTEVSEDLLKAFLLDYADMPAFGISPHAAFFTSGMHTPDRERFCMEVMSRWINAGAPAKQKWVLGFACAHGGEDVLDLTKRCIKEWSERARGAIAADAVRALAFHQSPLALITLDDFSRTFKKAQVKDAAAAALQDAAEQQGITTEELADRIVPNLGFDAHKCRGFDYGSRQFTVTLLPDWKLSLKCDGKTLKSLPKPGARDEAEKAESAYKAFSDLKKQLRTVSKLQMQRLEYALLCGRTWDMDSWKKLMLQNPVMTPFAVSLIWGIYSENGLESTFRYMDDGSFSDKDGEEFVLPEEGKAGLVHPLELTVETLSAWKEQLEDFEVIQPFPQLTRSVYTVGESDRARTEFSAFSNTRLDCLTLRGKMKKNGWTTGEVLDGGFFEEFRRTDLTGCRKDERGKRSDTGYAAVLKFSGMDISGYYQEAVDMESVKFFSLKDGNYRLLSLGEVPPRYYSEIIGQLTQLFIRKTDTKEEA